MQEIINCYSILSCSLSRKKGQGSTSPKQTHLVTPLENFVSIDPFKRVFHHYEIFYQGFKLTHKNHRKENLPLCIEIGSCKAIGFPNGILMFFENNFDDISFSIILCQLLLLEKTNDSKIELFKKMVDEFSNAFGKSYRLL